MHKPKVRAIYSIMIAFVLTIVTTPLASAASFNHFIASDGTIVLIDQEIVIDSSDDVILYIELDGPRLRYTNIDTATGAISISNGQVQISASMTVKTGTVSSCSLVATITKNDALWGGPYYASGGRSCALVKSKPLAGGANAYRLLVTYTAGTETVQGKTGYKLGTG